jgi:hypothetical protein
VQPVHRFLETLSTRARAISYFLEINAHPAHYARSCVLSAGCRISFCGVPVDFSGFPHIEAGDKMSSASAGTS